MPDRTELLPMEAEEFLAGIQAQINLASSAANGPQSAVYFFPPDHSDPVRAESAELSGFQPAFISRLKKLSAESRVRLSQIGEIPTSPPTLRAMAGRRAIGILKTLLWWYTRSLTAFAEVVTRELQEQVACLEHLSNKQESERRSVVSLQASVATLTKRIDDLASRQRQTQSRPNQVESELSARLNQISGRVEELASAVETLRTQLASHPVRK